MIKWLLSKLWALTTYKALCNDLESAIADAKAIEGQFRQAAKTYTTIKSFYGNDDAFWKWAKELVAGDEYRYLIFCLRENTIREMTACVDEKKLIEFNGRLNMLQIIDRYINTGIKEYEDKLRRNN